MFFVGATGQLLTLILTVCLPFVFFISTPTNPQIAQETSFVNPIGIYTEIVSNEIHSKQIQAESTFEVSEISFYSETNSSIEYPPGNNHCCQSIYYQTSSGNKAPPTFLCYS